MNTVSSMGGHLAAQWKSLDVTSSRTKAVRQSVVLPKDAGDRNDVTVDWDKAVQDTLDDWKGQYSNVEILVDTLCEKNGIQKYAESVGSGTYLVVSQKFLDQMASGVQAFQKGKALLEQVLQSLSGRKPGVMGVGAYVDETSMTYWTSVEKKEESLFSKDFTNPDKTLVEWMQEAKEKAEKLKEAFQVKVNSSIYNQPAEIYSRLARAKTVQNVKSVMYTARNKIYQLKLAMGTADNEDREKIRAVLSQLQGTIGKARRKASSLQEEALLQKRQKRAEQEKQMRKARRLAYTIKKQKTSRVSKEYAQAAISSNWGLMMAEQARRRQAQEQKYENAVASAAAVSTAVPAVSVPAVAGVAAAPVVSVTVSAPVSISIA